MFLPPTPKNKTRPTIYMSAVADAPLRSGYWSSESAPPEITDFREATLSHTKTIQTPYPIEIPNDD